MANFYNITGYIIGDDKSPVKYTINIDHILMMVSERQNPNNTIIQFSDESRLIVGQKIEEILKVFQSRLSSAE